MSLVDQELGIYEFILVFVVFQFQINRSNRIIYSMSTLEFYLLANSLVSVQELQTKNDTNIPNELLELALLFLKGLLQCDAH